jgi:hypothetical protein
MGNMEANIHLLLVRDFRKVQKKSYATCDGMGRYTPTQQCISQQCYSAGNVTFIIYYDYYA